MASKQAQAKPVGAVPTLRQQHKTIADDITRALVVGDISAVTHAIGVAAKARGMSEISRQTGLSRESLYRSLSGEGDPRFGTITRVLEALGLQLRVERAAAD